jgi:hypothetical protein
MDAAPRNGDTFLSPAAMLARLPVIMPVTAFVKKALKVIRVHSIEPRSKIMPAALAVCLCQLLSANCQLISICHL